jgi:3-(3-hydroxy-phenyl)propionate hydroxylase
MAELERVAAELSDRVNRVDIIRVDAADQGANNTTYLSDDKGVLAQRYDLQQAAVYLIRPDQHVAARWRELDPVAITAALERAMGFELQEEKAA